MLDAAIPTLEGLQQPIARRLASVQDELAAMVEADFGAVNEVNDYLLSARGKFLRPTLVLLCNEVGGRPAPEAVRLAAVVELMHVATLVHDDAVDHSPERRGMPTVNSRWSHQVAVIMGDYLYSRALVEITSMGRIEAVHLLADASNRMSIGEMRQLAAHDALGATEDDYYLLCDRKTASLISAACELGAMYGTPEHAAALAGYGRDLGMTFQITDDLLDYTQTAEVTGKPSGLDLREHKVTLPLIAALPELGPSERSAVEDVFEDPQPSDEKIQRVVRLVREAGGLDYARQKARDYADAARLRLADLPDEPAVRILDQAVDFVVGRSK
ncbi:MAG: polyprenyl synthetase family protein [marine benthic group bacterium]|jgi:octaprenyl-diphosphate synthase|nr:polyprenyl synthetase family protein [Candidatus Benthicola marisminoris]